MAKTKKERLKSLTNSIKKLAFSMQQINKKNVVHMEDVKGQLKHKLRMRVIVKVSPSRKLHTGKWQKLKQRTYGVYGRMCYCCWKDESDGVQLTIDHILPISKHPKLKYDISNLQVLCFQCNQNKDNFEIDYRRMLIEILPEVRQRMKNYNIKLPDEYANFLMK